MRNLKHIFETETALDDFANISEPNSISPTTVRTLLRHLLLQIDDSLDQLWTGGSGIVDMEVSIVNDEFVFNDFPIDYLHKECIVNVRCLLDTDQSTVFIGRLSVRSFLSNWEYLIYAPFGIFKATGDGNNPPANWTLKKYVFQTD